jgi:hypothetical protein
MQFKIDFLCYGPQNNIVGDALTWPPSNIYQKIKWNELFL